MCRLAINGLKSGHQPFFNEDKSVVAIVNGEIYNYLELREALQVRGHRFQGDSDCEVLIHLYEEHGPDFPSEVAGMFAVALWDSKKKLLFLARDRLGEKPLYWASRQEGIYFASEIRALFQLLGDVPPADLSAWTEFLLFEYVHDPATPFQGISKLEPGTVRIFSVSGQSRSHTFWDFPGRQPDPGSVPEQDVGQCLEQASRQILRSERPVAVALSGGMDSGLVLALAVQARGGGEGLQAITIGYPGKPEMDEREAARRLAQELGVRHHTVELSVEEVVEDFPRMVQDCDDLLADIAAPGYRAVARASQRIGAPVLLMGQGGDELFWGYRWVRETAQKLAVGQGTAPREILRDTVCWQKWTARLEARKFFLYRRSLEVSQALRGLPVRGMLPPWRQSARRAGQRWDDQNQEAGCRVTRLIARSYLLANGLPLADRLGMAFSVEARQLFLDHRLWETVLGHRGQTPDYFLAPKAWLKGWACHRLPAWWLNLPKRGFTPPAQAWKRAVVARYADWLEKGWWVESGLVSARWIRQVVALSGSKARYADMAYKLLVGEVWMQKIRSCADPHHPA